MGMGIRDEKPSLRDCFGPDSAGTWLKSGNCGLVPSVVVGVVDGVTVDVDLSVGVAGTVAETGPKSGN